MDEDAFEKFHTSLGFAMRIVKHQSEDADKLIMATNHKKIDRETAVFLNNVANLQLEYEEQEGGIDMCLAMEKRVKKERIIGAMEYMKDEGKTEKDIIGKGAEKMQATVKIEGMMCGHCEANVKKAMEALPFVESAEVSHEKGTAVISLCGELDAKAVQDAVEAKDYTFVGISS